MMADRQTYHVFAERDRRWWVLKVLELDQWSQAKRLDQAEATARDLIALWLDVGPDSFDVELTSVRMAPAATAARDHAIDARRAAEAATAKAAEATKLAITTLAKDEISLRDIGRILGISFQRVAQLAANQASPVLPRDITKRGGIKHLRHAYPTAEAARATARAGVREATHATIHPKTPAR